MITNQFEIHPDSFQRAGALAVYLRDDELLRKVLDDARTLESKEAIDSTLYGAGRMRVYIKNENTPDP